MAESKGYIWSRNLIVRRAVVDSALTKTVYKMQAVNPYAYFNTAAPTLSFDLGELTRLSGQALAMAVQASSDELNFWYEEVFGKGMEGSSVTKIGFTYGGKFGKHLGRGGTIRSDANLDRGMGANIQDPGEGALAFTILCFEWNDLEQNRGFAELAKPAWDQKLWTGNSNSIMEPPTLRTAVTTYMGVVATAASVAVSAVASPLAGGLVASAITFATDAAFSGLDFAEGYKDAKQTGKDIGISAATNAIGAVSGVAGNFTSGMSGLAGIAVKTSLTAGTGILTKGSSSLIQNGGNWNAVKNDFNSFSDWSGIIASTAGSLVTNSLGAANGFDANGKAFNSSTFNVSGVEKFDSLAGGLTTAALNYGFTGETTLNVLNVADLLPSDMFKGTKLKGKSISSGLLEVSVGKKGVKSRIGNGGTDISFGTLRTAFAGAKEAKKITSWKYGGIEKRSTLNGINMLGWTKNDNNKKLSKEIWDETLGVEYGDTDGDYGNYRQGDKKITLSRDLLGGGAEASAKLATVMAHEGTHYYGNRIEGVAHSVGFDTYAQINKMFNLEGDSSFAGQMIDEIMNKDSWKENTGDVDHWRMTWGGQLIGDHDGWLKDENGYYINEDGTHTPERQANTIGAAGIETGLLNILFGERQADGTMKNHGKKYGTAENNYADSDFTDEQVEIAQNIMKKAKMTDNGTPNPRELSWSNTLGKKLDMHKVMSASGNNISSEVFNTYYNNKVDSQIGKALGVDLGFDTGKSIPSNQYGNYTNLLLSRFADYIDTGDAKQALTDKYFQTITNENGESTKLYKLDKNNPFLDRLVKQTDSGLDETINNSGCNFMATIAVPQLLTGKILKPAEIQSIWNESTEKTFVNQYGETRNWIDSIDSNVNNPDKVANYTFKNIGFANFELRYGWSGNNFKKVGCKVKVPYSTTGHWLLADKDLKYLYNPANTTGSENDNNPIYLRKN